MKFSGYTTKNIKEIFSILGTSESGLLEDFLIFREIPAKDEIRMVSNLFYFHSLIWENRPDTISHTVDKVFKRSKIENSRG